MPKESIEIASKTPFLCELKAEVSQAITDGTGCYERDVTADATRFCAWEGQSSDGRKHAEDLGKAAWPWEGASDTTVRTADEIINEQVMLLKAAFFRGKAQVAPTKSRAMGQSQNMSTLMNWVFQSQMLPEARREVELAAQWRQGYGKCLMEITWDQELRWETKQASIAELKAMADETKNPQITAIINAIFDPLAEEGLIGMLQQVVEGISKAGARKIIHDLRTEGAAEWPQKYIFQSRPKWEALRAGVDVFFPRGTTDLQKARFIAKREWVTETQLKEREHTEEYDKRFIAEALKHKGASSRPDVETRRDRYSDTGVTDDFKDLIELIHVRYRANDDGATRIYHTVFHESVKDYCAKHDSDGYKHGLYPYVALVREWVNTTIMDSRGVSEIARLWQQEIKQQRDSKSDRASIATLPPLKHPQNRGKFDVLLGPGKSIPERRPNEVGWMPPPQYDPGADRVEASARGDCNEYFGLMRGDVHPTKQLLAQQSLTDDFLIEMSLCVMQTFQLAEEFMSPEEVQRVVGPLQAPMDSSRQDTE